MGFRAAWWEACGDLEHRMLQWLQLVSLANLSPPTTDHSLMSVVQKEVAATACSSRSRISVVCTESEPQEQGKGKGKGKKTGPGKRPPAGSVWLLNDLPKGGEEVAKMLHQNQGNGVCYAFQEDSCQHGLS